jgi:hypothetical protein
MIRVLGWIGLYMGTPSMATWVAAVYVPVLDHSVTFFFVSVLALLVAILPRLNSALPEGGHGTGGKDPAR